MAVYAALFYIIIRTGKIYIQAAVFKYDNGTKKFGRDNVRLSFASLPACQGTALDLYIYK